MATSFCNHKKATGGCNGNWEVAEGAQRAWDAMSKKAAAAATPAAAAAVLACGNAECGKALAPPLLQCSKCKGEAYCCKACQVPPAPRTRSARCAH